MPLLSLSLFSPFSRRTSHPLLPPLSASPLLLPPAAEIAKNQYYGSYSREVTLLRQQAIHLQLETEWAKQAIQGHSRVTDEQAKKADENLKLNQMMAGAAIAAAKGGAALAQLPSSTSSAPLSSAGPSSFASLLALLKNEGLIEATAGKEQEKEAKEAEGSLDDTTDIIPASGPGATPDSRLLITDATAAASKDKDKEISYPIHLLPLVVKHGTARLHSRLSALCDTFASVKAKEEALTAEAGAYSRRQASVQEQRQRLADLTKAMSDLQASLSSEKMITISKASESSALDKDIGTSLMLLQPLQMEVASYEAIFKQEEARSQQVEAELLEAIRYEEEALAEQQMLLETAKEEEQRAEEAASVQLNEEENYRQLISEQQSEVESCKSDVADLFYRQCSKLVEAAGQSLRDLVDYVLTQAATRDIISKYDDGSAERRTFFKIFEDAKDDGLFDLEDEDKRYNKWLADKAAAAAAAAAAEAKAKAAAAAAKKQQEQSKGMSSSEKRKKFQEEKAKRVAASAAKASSSSSSPSCSSSGKGTALVAKSQGDSIGRSVFTVDVPSNRNPHVASEPDARGLSTERVLGRFVQFIASRVTGAKAKYFKRRTMVMQLTREAQWVLGYDERNEKAQQALETENDKLKEALMVSHLLRMADDLKADFDPAKCLKELLASDSPLPAAPAPLGSMTKEEAQTIDHFFPLELVSQVGPLVPAPQTPALASFFGSASSTSSSSSSLAALGCIDEADISNAIKIACRMFSDAADAVDAAGDDEKDKEKEDGKDQKEAAAASSSAVSTRSIGGAGGGRASSIAAMLKAPSDDDDNDDEDEDEEVGKNGKKKSRAEYRHKSEKKSKDKKSITKAKEHRNSHRSVDAAASATEAYGRKSRDKKESSGAGSASSSSSSSSSSAAALVLGSTAVPPAVTAAVLASAGSIEAEPVLLELVAAAIKRTSDDGGKDRAANKGKEKSNNKSKSRSGGHDNDAEGDGDVCRGDEALALLASKVLNVLLQRKLWSMAVNSVAEMLSAATTVAAGNSNGGGTSSAMILAEAAQQPPTTLQGLDTKAAEAFFGPAPASFWEAEASGASYAPLTLALPPPAPALAPAATKAVADKPSSLSLSSSSSAAMAVDDNKGAKEQDAAKGKEEEEEHFVEANSELIIEDSSSDENLADASSVRSKDASASSALAAAAKRAKTLAAVVATQQAGASLPFLKLHSLLVSLLLCSSDAVKDTAALAGALWPVIEGATRSASTAGLAAMTGAAPFSLASTDGKDNNDKDAMEQDSASSAMITTAKGAPATSLILSSLSDLTNSVFPQLDALVSSNALKRESMAAVEGIIVTAKRSLAVVRDELERAQKQGEEKGLLEGFERATTSAASITAKVVKGSSAPSLSSCASAPSQGLPSSNNSVSEEQDKLFEEAVVALLDARAMLLLTRDKHSEAEVALEEALTQTPFPSVVKKLMTTMHLLPSSGFSSPTDLPSAVAAFKRLQTVLAAQRGVQLPPLPAAIDTGDGSNAPAPAAPSLEEWELALMEQAQQEQRAREWEKDQMALRAKFAAGGAGASSQLQLAARKAAQQYPLPAVDFSLAVPVDAASEESSAVTAAADGQEGKQLRDEQQQDLGKRKESEAPAAAAAGAAFSAPLPLPLPLTTAVVVAPGAAAVPAVSAFLPAPSVASSALAAALAAVKAPAAAVPTAGSDISAGAVSASQPQPSQQSSSSLLNGVPEPQIQIALAVQQKQQQQQQATGAGGRRGGSRNSKGKSQSAAVSIGFGALKAGNNANNRAMEIDGPAAFAFDGAMEELDESAAAAAAAPGLNDSLMSMDLFGGGDGAGNGGSRKTTTKLGAGAGAGGAGRR